MNAKEIQELKEKWHKYQYTDGIVCPYCLEEIVDECWDLVPDEHRHEMICAECDKKFSCSAEFTTTYISHPKELQL